MKIIRQPQIDPPIGRIDIDDYYECSDKSGNFSVSLTPNVKRKRVAIRIGSYGFDFAVGKADELSEALKLLVDQIKGENT